MTTSRVLARRRLLLVTALASALFSGLLSGCGSRTVPTGADVAAPAARSDATPGGGGATSEAAVTSLTGTRASFALWVVDEVTDAAGPACPASTVSSWSPADVRRTADARTPPGAGVLRCFRRATGGERLGPEAIEASDARRRPSGGAWYVALTLTPDGLDRLNRLATAARLGSGLLAVEFGGRVLIAPAISGEFFTAPTIDISGDVDERQARAIAQTLASP